MKRSIRSKLAERGPGNTKLHETDVRRIREDLERQEMRAGEFREQLARRHGVSRRVIDAIARGER